jgi:hypothetical protein
VKKQETFSQLIDRLADFSGLGWLRCDVESWTKETATEAIREHLKLCQKGYEAHYAGCARAALEELDKFDSGDATIASTSNSWTDDFNCFPDVAQQNDPKEYMQKQFGSWHYSRKWKPTEQDYRDCCGIWVDPVGIKTRVVPSSEYGQGKSLLDFECIEEFNSFAEDKGLARLEPMPEQCIPKRVQKERYNVPFPLLRGEE